MKRMFLAGAVVAMLAGCGAHRGASNNVTDPNRLELVGAQETGLTDAMEANVEIKTDLERNIGFWGTGDKYLLRGFIDKKTLEADYQLYAITVSFSWMFWDSLKYLDQGNLKQSAIIRVGSDVQCGGGACFHTEEQILKLSRNDIDPWAKSDTTVRLASSKVSGNVDIVIKKDVTTNFLKAMDQTVAFLKRQNPVQTTIAK